MEFHKRLSLSNKRYGKDMQEICAQSNSSEIQNFQDRCPAPYLYPTLLPAFTRNFVGIIN
jgi:hypothetical protein